ncbi:ghrelin/obestatin prepropeptide, partial [Tachysurus ichikawai]
GRGDRKPPRVGRRTAAELEPTLHSEDKIMVSAPFQLAVSLSDTQYEDYGPVLQRMLLDVLGGDPPTSVGF